MRNVEPEEEAAGRIPEALARELNAVPIHIRDDGSLEVVVSYPDLETMRRLEAQTGGSVHLQADYPGASTAVARLHVSCTGRRAAVR